MVPGIKERVSIVIPCYNEEKGLPQLISKLKLSKNDLLSDFEVELIFVDDGSTDTSNEILHKKYDKEENVQIVKHTQNCGLGAALRTGFSKATGNIIVTIDSDCTYDPEQIPNMLKALDKQIDIVIGSPYHPLGKVDGTSFLRMFLSKSLSSVYRLVLSQDLHTYTGIFRAYRRSVVTDIKFKANDFISLSEILVKSIFSGYEVFEYPTILYHRKFGRSKIHIITTIFHHLRFILRIILNKRSFIDKRGDINE